MKTLFEFRRLAFFATLFTLGVFNLTSAIAAGVGAGGGGNAGKSTPEDVRKALGHVRNNVSEFYYQACTGSFREVDSELAKIFSVMCPHGSYNFGQTTLGGDIGLDDGKIPGSSFILQNGSCHDLDGHESDAAVTAGAPLTPICFSIPRLQNIPPEALKKRIFALAAHEFVHHYNNFGEVEALKVQVFALEHYDEIAGEDGFKMSLAFYLDNVLRSAGHLQGLLNYSDRTEESTCLTIGELDHLTWAMEVAVGRYKFADQSFDNRGYELMSRAAGLSFYCGGNNTSQGDSRKYAVKLKDLSGLRERLNEFIRLQSTFRDDVKKALGVTVNQ